jgi:hypothetical protein
VIERVHIQLLRVMSGYSVRGSFTHDRLWPDEAHDVAVYHGWIVPGDLEDDQVVLEHLSEELFNLAPRWRGPMSQRRA